MTGESSGFWTEFLQNRVMWASFTAWLTAQFLKGVVGVLRKRRFNFKWFVNSGGMPSSHTAAVVGLATALGIEYGFDSPLVAIASVYALIIMFDAQGVRRQSGKQAEALNMILDDIYAMKGIRMEPLKSLFGHTPIEVIAGALVGVTVVLLVL